MSYDYPNTTIPKKAAAYLTIPETVSPKLTEPNPAAHHQYLVTIGKINYR